MPRGLWLVIPAALIDLLQAGVSAAMLALGAVAGTAGGAVGGALAGSTFCNNVGLSFMASTCATVGGAAGAVGGTFLDPFLAPVGIPMGIALGFAINICISMTFGIAFIILPLALMRMLHVQYLWTGLGEMIPGLDNLPFWSALVIMCVLRTRKDEKGRMGSTKGILRLLPKSVGGAVAGVALAQASKLNADTERKKQTMRDIRPSTPHAKPA